MAENALEHLDVVEEACADIAGAAKLLIAAKHDEAKLIIKPSCTEYLAKQLLEDQARLVVGAQAVVDYVLHQTMGHSPTGYTPVEVDAAKAMFEEMRLAVADLRIGARLLMLPADDAEQSHSSTISYLVKRVANHTEVALDSYREAYAHTFGVVDVAALGM